MKQMLKIKGVTVDERMTLNDMLRLPETDAFVNHDYRFSDDIYLVKKIGNAASHDGGEPITRARAFRCLRSFITSLQVYGALDAVKNIPHLIATTISCTDYHSCPRHESRTKGRDGGGQQRTERDARRPTTSGDTS